MIYQPQIGRIAIGSMVWSVLSGAGVLIAIPLIVRAQNDGYADTMPREFFAFYTCIEILLALILWGVLQQHRQVRMALSLLLILIASVTLLSPSLDLIFVLSIEAVWLGPWFCTAYFLWRGDQP